MLSEPEYQLLIKKCTYKIGNNMNNIIFLWGKKTNELEAYEKYQLILNVKELNRHVKFTRFKLDNFSTCLQLMEPECLDSSYAYHTIPMHVDFTKFFKLQFQNIIFIYMNLFLVYLKAHGIRLNL